MYMPDYIGELLLLFMRVAGFAMLSYVLIIVCDYIQTKRKH